MSDWLDGLRDSIPVYVHSVRRGSTPLVLSIPHAGTIIPPRYQKSIASPWLARKDADWWLPELYAFAEEFDATIVRNFISRTIIDVNRDPSGLSLYPGQATTGLCPTTTFDGEVLFANEIEPADIEFRKAAYFDIYHQTLAEEIARLKEIHGSVVLYDCHSIRSQIPRLFDGVLPNFNIGTYDGRSCDPALTGRVAAICEDSGYSCILNGRFKGGWITRHYGNPANGVHAIQMELACRGYMVEPDVPDESNWPSLYDENYAEPMRKILQTILESLLP